MKTVLLLFGLLIAPIERDSSFKDDNKIDLIDNTKVPIVEGFINGVRVYLVLDSGASMSVLDLSQAKALKFFAFYTDQEAAGYGGRAKLQEVRGVRAAIEDLPIYADFMTQDLSTVREIIQRNEGIYISGIIGSDVLKSIGATINYSNNTLTISN